MSGACGLEPAPELAPPSVDRVVFRIFAEAIIASMPRKRAERVLKVVAERAAQAETMAAIFPLRPTGQQAEVRRVRRQAAEIIEGLLPILYASIREE